MPIDRSSTHPPSSRVAAVARRLLDECVLGGGTFVTVSVHRGGRVKLEKTESVS